MNERKKVIRGLEACVCDSRLMQCANCPYHTDKSRCVTTLMRDALALLKEQEPRVMTLEEVETSKGFVWVEFNSINGNRLSLEYVRVTECLRDSFILSTDSGIKWLRDRGDYNRGIWFGMNSGWRCWTARPSEKMRNEVPWDD